MRRAHGYRGGYRPAEPSGLPCELHGLELDTAPFTGLCPACFAESLEAAGLPMGPGLRIWLEIAGLRRRRAVS